MNQEAKQYLVTTYDNKTKSQEPLWSQIWNPKNPIGIGHPFRWIIEKTNSGVRVRDIGVGVEQIIRHSLKEYSLGDLEKPIQLENLSLRIQPVIPFDTHWKPKPILEQWIPQKENFRKTFLSVLGLVLVTGTILMLFVPSKKENEELIPPQFAKVILSPAIKNKPIETRESGAKGNENNVVHAFRSDSVKKTTSALFNAGAAKSLLNNSKLMDVVGNKIAVKQVFGSRSSLSGELNKQEGNTLDPKASKVGLIGGGGGGKGTGEFGYGTDAGGRAVAGQGNGMVGFSTEGMGVDEGLTKDEVGKVIRQHLSEIRYCYESAMLRNPGLEGKAVLSFVINQNGVVTKASPKESSGDSGLDNCIISHLFKWAFPKPRGGTDVGVSYPFIFKSLSN